MEDGERTGLRQGAHTLSGLSTPAVLEVRLSENSLLRVALLALWDGNVSVNIFDCLNRLHSSVA